MDIQGRGALVTGASKGLGRALAAELARAGAKVVLVARPSAELEAAAAALRAEGHEAHALPADVGDKQAIYPLAGAAAALVGPIELLVHNASTLGVAPLRPLLDTDCETLERVLAVNLVGPFRLSKALAGPMALRGRGLIVQITSDAAVEAYPRWGAYGASKAALDHLGRIWAAELEGTGVRFLSVDPGEMDTLMHAAAIPEADLAALAKPEEVARKLAALIAREGALRSGARLAASELQVRR